MTIIKISLFCPCPGILTWPAGSTSTPGLGRVWLCTRARCQKNWLIFWLIKIKIKNRNVPCQALKPSQTQIKTFFKGKRSQRNLPCTRSGPVNMPAPAHKKSLINTGLCRRGCVLLANQTISSLFPRRSKVLLQFRRKPTKYMVHEARVQLIVAFHSSPCDFGQGIENSSKNWKAVETTAG